MPRLTKIYTRTGDEGLTSLGGGKRVTKDSLRIEAFGTVDELNAHIGLALALGVHTSLLSFLKKIQNDAFHLGSDLCMPEADKQKKPVPKIEQRHVDELEGWMDRLLAELSPLENFILPGGSSSAAQLHVARTVCRRAERVVIALSKKEQVGPFTIKYLNRLSDALFVLARYENKLKGEKDVYWDSRA